MLKSLNSKDKDSPDVSNLGFPFFKNSMKSLLNSVVKPVFGVDACRFGDC